jgi:acyl carrier protein
VSAPEIEAWLVARIARALGVAPTAIDPGQPLDALGLDSLRAAMVVTELETFLGAPLPAALLFEYPSLRRLAAQLADAPPSE